MYIKNMINKQIQKAITMDEKSTHSDKFYNTGAVVTSIVSVTLLILCFVVSLVNLNYGLLVWQYLFYPILVFNIAAIFLSFAQLMRNRYFSVMISSTISVLTLIALIVSIILQAVILKKVYIVPFVFF